MPEKLNVISDVMFIIVMIAGALDMLSCHSLIDGLVLDCSNSSALAVELLQSFSKPLLCD